MTLAQNKALYAMALGIALAGGATAQAANIAVSGNITTSTTWTANNVYNLIGQVNVMPGATLTIEPGTLIKSNPADQGSLAIVRGAKIIANGTPTKPIIFTSTNDDLVTERSVDNEWGTVTIMGKALISKSTRTGNTAVPDGTNVAVMEGLTSNPNDTNPNVLYGGNDDNDDSGSLSYVSLRYGGKVLGMANELNGLSLGGVGRETDIHHVDIFCNIDDGIEIWGGTVNLKYVSIWYCGDDSLDIDQGWRGKAQFGLIVQGASRPTSTSTGSGLGDNAFEMDGAEACTAQPVTTGVIYNFTVIGQGHSSFSTAKKGNATEWRDGCRMQIRNSIFMDMTNKLILNKITDGEGNGTGYGDGGTLTLAQTFTTPYNTYSSVNDGGLTLAQKQALYAAQTSGNLSEITGCVFYNFLRGDAAYNSTDAGSTGDCSDSLGVTVSGGSNPAKDNIVATQLPIKSIVRGTPVGGHGVYTVVPVVSLDPRAANDAVSLITAQPAPADGFFTPAPFRGAFSKDVNWCKGWTAADAYGKFTGTGFASDPAGTNQIQTTTIDFQTVNGVVYTVESSVDGKNWRPEVTIIGDGSVKTVGGLITTDPAKIYRAIAQ